MPQNLHTADQYKTLYKTPTEILNKQNSQIYYKQDDAYASPMAGIRCKIMTTDLGYPKTIESKTFAQLWASMFTTSLNEFNFMAD